MFLVMLVFLQNLRATLIPTLVVPVALMGAFIGMYAFGFTINQLTLFGMVLAIGIVVDDAIVVIENVERIMREEKLPPKEATTRRCGRSPAPSSRSPGARRRVHSERPAGRQRRRHLSPVRAHDRGVDGYFRVPRALLHTGALRHAPESTSRRRPTSFSVRSTGSSTGPSPPTCAACSSRSGTAALADRLCGD